MRDRGMLVSCVDTHPNPVRRRVGQIPEIRVLGESFKLFRYGDGLRRCVLATLFRDLGWSRVSSVAALDLDLLVWMEACPTAPLTLPSLSDIRWEKRDKIRYRSNTRCHNLSPPDNVFGGTPLQILLALHPHPLRPLRSCPATKLPFQKTRDRVFVIGCGVGAPRISPELEIVSGFWHPVHGDPEAGTPRERIPCAQVHEDQCG